MNETDTNNFLIEKSDDDLINDLNKQEFNTNIPQNNQHIPATPSLKKHKN